MMPKSKNHAQRLYKSAQRLGQKTYGTVRRRRLFMELKYDSRIYGDFEGWDGDAVFELINGTKWQQTKHKYKYKYKYQPVAKIWKDGSRYFLEVDGMPDMIQVRRL